MDEHLTLHETRKILQRGPHGGATLLPRIFMTGNNLWRGSRLKMWITQDKKSLVVTTENTILMFTREDLVPVGDYGLGIHAVRSGKDEFKYPIITLPQKYLDMNDLSHGDAINIYTTPMEGCVVIKKKERE